MKKNEIAFLACCFIAWGLATMALWNVGMTYYDGFVGTVAILFAVYGIWILVKYQDKEERIDPLPDFTNVSKKAHTL